MQLMVHMDEWDCASDLRQFLSVICSETIMMVLRPFEVSQGLQNVMFIIVLAKLVIQCLTCNSTLLSSTASNIAVSCVHSTSYSSPSKLLRVQVARIGIAELLIWGQVIIEKRMHENQHLFQSLEPVHS